jgi:predicted lipoprotein with Yx(FWY)xxD motif
MRRKIGLLTVPALVVALIALVVAGCGGNGDDNVKAGPPAASAKVSTPSGGKATVGVRTGSLGKYLVDSQGRTLYLFEKDRGRRNSCYGQCAKFWPPLLTGGKPSAASSAKSSLLGTTRRSNGTMQVTYAGHPLYRFTQDKKSGQTTGEGLKFFGASWYVLSPSGKKIDKD